MLLARPLGDTTFADLNPHIRVSHTCREQFVKLHQGKLLEALVAQWHREYPNVKLPERPKTGKLDLGEVRRSKYFFN